MRTSINLMTDEDKRRQLLHDVQTFWVKVLLTTMMVILGVGTYHWWQNRVVLAELSELEEQYAPMQMLKDECIDMRTSINNMREAQQLMLRLVDTRPVVTLLGAVSHAAAETSGGVYIQSIELEPTERSGDARRAVMHGMGYGNSAIAQFTSALRSSNLFADVTLSSSASSTNDDDAATAFRIECQL
ncbi:PilN domain-containing protein [Aeoliella mucimassa]|uniref:Fimbrial assembly protein (PilN) n=1 Tax=Aeoliella mucimassa TaxID=2527972 RepID=A0A518AJ62_9BACT|nr:PilN domain-containing protein [Aeoliella mucimassa]QDU54771.1 hypothetical protein Pan181_09540 [Aeoliella mucimassa]